VCREDLWSKQLAVNDPLEDRESSLPGQEIIYLAVNPQCKRERKQEHPDR
jgi:hypothetical protein